jgi:hypothetical protein
VEWGEKMGKMMVCPKTDCYFKNNPTAQRPYPKARHCDAHSYNASFCDKSASGCPTCVPYESIGQPILVDATAVCRDMAFTDSPLYDPTNEQDAVDPDEGLVLKPGVELRLRGSINLPKEQLLTSEQMRAKIEPPNVYIPAENAEHFIEIMRSHHLDCPKCLDFKKQLYAIVKEVC